MSSTHNESPVEHAAQLMAELQGGGASCNGDTPEKAGDSAEGTQGGTTEGVRGGGSKGAGTVGGGREVAGGGCREG